MHVRTALLAFALAVACVMAVRFAFELPAPTGPLPVGTVTLTLERPPEPNEGSAGRFAVQVWYPAKPSTDRAPYGSGSPGLKRWIYRRLVRTHAARGVGIASSQGRFPVIVYVAGWGNERTDNTVLSEELASHGFVVAAFGDVGYDDPPLRRLGGPTDFSSERAYHATLQLGHEKLRYDVQRASAVLDRLAMLDAGDSAGRFTHRLDLSRAGILGYSFGGAVAVAACRGESRFKAAMNMDGWLFDAGSGYRSGVPYFLVTDRSPTPGPDDLKAADPMRRYTSQLTVADEERQHEVLRRGGYELRIAGADHLSFTDVPLYAPLHRFSSHVNPERVARAVRGYAVAFFERVLDGKSSPLLVPGDKAHPAMTLASWPSGARP